MAGPVEAPDVGPASPVSRVVVLGGTGLLGAAISRAFLDAGARVTALARRPPDHRRAAALRGATLVEGDAGDAGLVDRLLEGADHLVVTLAAPHPAASLAVPVAQFGVELPALLVALESLRAHRGASLTFASTGGAIYGHGDVHPLPESAECRPISPYGVAKLAAERYVHLAADADGLDVRILRIANAYGPLQRAHCGQGIVAAALRAAATGSTLTVFGDGSAIRDFVHVDDVARAAVGLAGLCGGPRTVNVGTGHAHTVHEVLDIVRQTTGRGVNVDYEPSRRSDVSANVLDVARLSSMIPWSPVGLRHGIARTWAALEAAA